MQTLGVAISQKREKAKQTMSQCIICAVTCYLTCVTPQCRGTPLLGKARAQSKDSFTDLCAAADAW